METAQKSNKMTPEKRIEQIWNENSKIPFMQSKAILAFGFNKGMEYSIDVPSSITPIKKEKQNSEVINNSKETIKLTDIEKEQIKLDIVNEILNFITDKRDLMETYTKVKDMKTSINKRIKTLRKKNG